LARSGECGGEVTFEITQDGEASPADIVVEVLSLPGACDQAAEGSYDPLPVTATIISEAVIDPECSGLDPNEVDPVTGEFVVDPDDGCRRDAEGNVVPQTFRTTRFTALLPSVDCVAAAGSTVLWRVIVDDGIDVLEGPTVCFTYGLSDPTVVVSEYQPRNETTLEAICLTCDETEICLENCEDCELLSTGNAREACRKLCPTCFEFEDYGVRAVRTPDWIEVFNYGSETVDLRGIGFRGRTNNNIITWEFERNTNGEVTSIAPGERIIVFADDEENDPYLLVHRDNSGAPVPDASRNFWSAPFNLNPTRPRLDTVLLRSELTGTIFDDIILDFRQYAADNGVDLNDPVQEDALLEDFSVGRFPDLESGLPLEELYPRDALQPGTVTPCPTPGEPNILVCDVPPTFRPEVVLMPRCPAADAPIRLRSAVSIDNDSISFEVVVRYDSQGGDSGSIVLSEADLALSPTQVLAAPDSTLYDIDLELPGQPDGAVVEVSIEATSIVQSLSRGAVESTSTLSHLELEGLGVGSRSLVYRSGSAEPLGVVLNEILPRNVTIPIPGAPRTYITDYLELHLPEESASDAVDLSGYYLTDQFAPESEDSPIDEPRKFRIPDGTVIGRGEYLLFASSAPGEPVAGVVPLAGGVGFDCEGETTYLISPDDQGNCVSAQLTWTLGTTCRENEGAITSDADDLALGLTCSAGDALQELSAPSPLAPNGLPPVLIGAHHTSFLAEPNPCGATAFLVNVDFLIDSGLSDLGSDRVREAWVEIEGNDRIMVPISSLRTGAFPDGYPDLYPVPRGCTRDSDSCYEPLTFSAAVNARGVISDRLRSPSGRDASGWACSSTTRHLRQTSPDMAGRNADLQRASGDCPRISVNVRILESEKLPTKWLATL
ncbi:MAG: hypothetical protein AAF488_16615, partial [Planctomycetota bacterium]